MNKNKSGQLGARVKALTRLEPHSWFAQPESARFKDNHPACGYCSVGPLRATLPG
jgi:hypothetical protein